MAIIGTPSIVPGEGTSPDPANTEKKVVQTFSSRIEAVAPNGASSNNDGIAPAAPTIFSVKITPTTSSDDPLGKYTVLLQDPLSEVTRKERRTLLGVGILAVAVVQANLIPNEIAAFGMKSSQIDPGALIGVLFLVVLYFLATFIAYGVPDFIAWKINLWKGMKTAAIEKQKAVPDNMVATDQTRTDDFDARMSGWASWAGLTSLVRTLFDFVLPIGVGLYALFILWNYEPPKKVLSEPSTIELPPI